VTVADRPERSSLNRVLSYSGTYSRRWLYSASFAPCKLASCKKCLGARVLRVIDTQPSSNAVSRSRVCKRKCADWDFDTTNRILNCSFPTNYPTTEHVDSPLHPSGRGLRCHQKKLPPVKLSYEFLKQACHYCFHNVYHKSWNIGMAETYLKTCAVNESFARKGVIDKAIKCRESDDAPEDVSSTLLFPVLWTRDGELRQCIDCPMHQLLQGTVSTVIDEVSGYMKSVGKHSQFGDEVVDTMEEYRLLGLDFCKVEKFGASASRQYSTGGWVGETYLGFSRVMLLLYSHFSTLCPNELHLPVMERLLQSLFAVMSRLFTLTPVCIGEIDDHIKLFLSCCHDFSISHRKGLFWFSKSNFVSLLNLPDQIDYFGALRLHWEGDREHFVQTPKRHLKTMRRTETFLQSKLGYLHKLGNLNNILESLSSNEHQTTYQKHSSLHIYSSFEDACDQHQQGKPMSGCLLNIGGGSASQLVLVFRESPGKIGCALVSFQDSLGKKVFGLWCAPIELTRCNNVGYPDTMSSVKKNLVDHVLFLIHTVTNDGKKHHLYCAQTMDWQVRLTGGVFKLFDVDHDLFYNLVN